MDIFAILTLKTENSLQRFMVRAEILVLHSCMVGLEGIESQRREV